MKEMLFEILKNAGFAFSGGFVGWFFTRKKQDEETNIIKGDVLHKIQDSYRVLVEDMNAKIGDLQNEIQILRKELEECKNNAKQYFQNNGSNKPKKN